MTEPAADPIELTKADLAAALAKHCPAHGIDLSGALGLPCPLPMADRFAVWLGEGLHGDLEYMTRSPLDRLDPTRRNGWARSVLVFAHRYTDGWPREDPDPSAGGSPDTETPWITRVARYARGFDYHDVLLRGIKGVLQEMRGTWPGLVFRASTDTGPYLEREYAWLAGLGFLGKNTCLIHESLGSGLFLGVALTNLEITGLQTSGEAMTRPLYGVVERRRRDPAVAYASACGSCTRCIETCPTGAIGPSGGLDAGRCISTWTIEWRGRPPRGCGSQQGDILFGCDICQAVCPWNHRAGSRAATLPEVSREYAARPEYDDLVLADLAEMTDEDFRAWFRRTPIWRCHPLGLRRNVRTVQENTP